ncbi:MAG: hypothetical protein CTY31_12980 [Hyphomicrobium sp.]|nr:MAG: hypothetical protein CTY39_07330 [Hyphomicrobium sp.]PPC98486.1 MAG: hypothetical protein CTY31_12980 [Hyphomicrobium sp.]
MKKTPLLSPLDWSHLVTEIPDAGLVIDKAASDTERAGLCEELGLLSLSQLMSHYRISRLAGGGYRLTGHVRAHVEQPCVVSLEAVADTLEEAFDVEFWPSTDHRDGGTEEGGQEKRVLEGRDVETLERGAIDAGRIVFETISSGLDPYPRKADAAFEWQDKAAAEPLKTNPFATLSKLKGKG